MVRKFLLLSGLVSFILACGGDKTPAPDPTPSTPDPTPRPIQNNIAFNDANFKAYLVRNFDANRDGEISYDEAKRAQGIFVSGLQIRNLDGIQYFTELQELDISHNQITNIDFTTSQAKLVKLTANNNAISGRVNIAPLTALTSVKIVEGNAGISLIHVANQIMANQFNAEDRTNKYTASGLVDEYIRFVDEKFKEAAVANADRNRDGEVTVGEAANFTGIFEVTSREVRTLEDIKWFKNISALKAANNNLASVSLSSFPNLTEIELGANLISSYQFHDLPKLKKLSLSGNSLTSFRLEGFTSLESLILSDNTNLSTIDISRLVSLKELNLKNTNLSGVLDLKNLTNLDSSLVTIKEVNRVTNISSSPNITKILVSTDSLAQILNSREGTNVYSGPSGVEERITISDTRLAKIIGRKLSTSKSEFTKSELQSIEDLIVDTNVKDASALSYCTGLTKLDFSASVSSFNFSNLIRLTDLTIGGNTLTSVTLGSGLVALKKINFSARNVRSLDISGCTVLTSFVLRQKMLVECIKTPTLQLAQTFNDANAGNYPSKDKFKTNCN